MAHLYVVPTCALCREPRSRPSMAIYHQSVSIVQRSAGQFVTAAAAYRAGVKIEDITTGLVHDYTRKKGIDYSEIMSPISASLGNEWLTDRQELWNKVEEIEKRKDAQLAREITLAIPRELDRQEQIALVREYVQTNYVAAGMVADINLHHLDGDNPHAHILLSMRNLQTTPEGTVEFGLKNTDWNSKELLLTHRKSWEEITNKYLSDYGSDIRIDCRSLKDQGSEFIPQIHVGVHAAAMHRKGLQTDRMDEFERIEAANNDIRNRLETTYQQEEYTPPELEATIDIDPPKIRDKDCELAQSIQEILGIGTEHSCLSVDFSEYRLRLTTNNHLQVYANSSPNKNKELILDFKLINGNWIDQLKNRISSSKYDSFYEAIEDIKTKVRDLDLPRTKARDRDCKLVQSIQGILGVGTKRSLSDIRFGEYKLLLVAYDHLQIYDSVIPKSRGKLILDFKLINGNWIDKMEDRISSNKYDNFYAAVEDIKTKVEDQNAKNNELCRLIQKLLEIHDVKSRVFYSVKFEINRKSDEIQVAISTEDNNFLHNKFSLENNQWIKHEGQIYDSEFVEYLLDGAKACINIANDVLNNYRFKDPVKLTNTEINEIIYHYRRNCDPDKSFTFMRKTHPNYTIYARESMIEDKWDIETIDMILGVKNKNVKQKIIEQLIHPNLSEQQPNLELKPQIESQQETQVDPNQQLDRELGSNIDWCLNAHNLSAMFITDYRISWDEKSQSLEVKRTSEISKPALLTIRYTSDGWVADEKDIDLKHKILDRILKANEKIDRYQSTSQTNRRSISR